ncbi:hypothetical protein FJZ55_07840 [Candidatus Woesearchaeota archaeon]|nr:hypothetical protein [Candidatus Woesearchaeota archaeon]
MFRQSQGRRQKAEGRRQKAEGGRSLAHRSVSIHTPPHLKTRFGRRSEQYSHSSFRIQTGG